MIILGLMCAGAAKFVDRTGPSALADSAWHYSWHIRERGLYRGSSL